MIKEHDTYDYNTVFTQKDAEVYAKLTDDYNPIHIDREYATATEFGRPVAQGVLILCAFAKVFGTMWPADLPRYSAPCGRQTSSHTSSLRMSPTSGRCTSTSPITSALSAPMLTTRG